MVVSAIVNPLDGEHVIGVSPKATPQVNAWNRRLNLFAGRSLSDIALTIEQNGRAGSLATRGQMVSPGVLSGLQIGLDKNDPRTLHVAAGTGICLSGEDVVVPKPFNVDIRKVSVYAPSYLIGEAPGGSGPQSSLNPQPAPQVQPGELYAREIGPQFNDFITQNVLLPQAGILLLEPVVIATLGNFVATNPCEEDAGNDAFDDEQLVDGCRLILYAWPTEWLALPAPGDAWQNRLAYAIFTQEASLSQDEHLPWEAVGLPIGLMAFDTAFDPLFLDRYSVVRGGGKPKPRTTRLPGTGDRFLWQARINQFAEQLTDPNVVINSPADLAGQCRFLPPTGLLPLGAIDLRQSNGNPNRVGANNFFPANYSVDAVPAPIEQIDLAINACAALAPFDTTVGDAVRVIVPVPQVWYEPELLQVETIDPIFQATVDQFVHQRAIWLKRRQDVRLDAKSLLKAIDASTPDYPDLDPNAIESNETVADTEIDTNITELATPEESYGTVADSTSGALQVSAIADLRTNLRGILRVGTNDESTVEDLSRLDTLGLQGFIHSLRQKADFSDDKINFGFLQIQSSVYKARQLMLGNDVGTRLATSPALTAIAQGQSAVATQQDLQAFYDKIKTPPATRALRTGGGGGTAPADAGTRGSNLASEVVPANRTARLTSSFVAPSKPALSIGRAPADIGGIAATIHTPITTGGIGGAGSIGATGAIDTIAPGLSVGAAGLDVVRPSNVTGILRTATAADPSLFATTNVAATKLDIEQQSPIVGESYAFRTVSVAERLQQPPANDTKSSAVATKFDVISTFATGNKGVAVGDLQVPGFIDPATNAQIYKPFSSIDPTVLGQILNKVHDPDPTNGDEGDFFGASVRAMDHTIETLRAIEGRVFAYRQAIQACQVALGTIQGLLSQANQRLTVIENALAQVRQDLVVARGLTADEQKRIDGINQQRDQIVSGQVKFLAFARLRESEAVYNVPVHAVDPAFTEAALPVALTRTVNAPPELRGMVNLLRDAPLKWFASLWSVLDRLDRLDTLHTAVLNTKLRATFKLAQPPEGDPPTSSGPLGQPILQAISMQREVVTQYRQTAAQLDISSFAGRSWQQSRDQAREFVSAGDLIDLSTFHPEIPRISASEMENIFQVAACLYADFSNVLPVIRLDWAQRLIQLQAGINLRNLSSLPKWNQIDYFDRQEMQAFVDWLFSRISADVPEAVTYMNTLVRVCLLLASHAPVTQIISGTVINPTTVGVGGRVSLAVDLARVRVGMHVLLYDANNTTVARGVVENLAAGQATARILTARSDTVSLEQNGRAQFAEAGAFERNPLTAGILRLR
jgi:hypothetical protein